MRPLYLSASEPPQSVLHALAASEQPILIAESRAGAAELLLSALAKRPDAQVIFVGKSLAEAVHLVQLGAKSYVESLDAAKALIPLPRLLPPEPWRRMLIGSSRAMQPVVDTIRLLGARRSTVLISGETGTGKEVVARAIHAASPRAREAMVSVNCTALPEALLEAELFGHVKGAYTGAFQARKGRFEEADRGTIFLDEIGDMPIETQAKLLRVLQEREFQRLGSSELVKVDVRIVAATNANLEEKIERGKFREDLFYRLNVVPLHLPPLRERPEDIPALIHFFIEKICQSEAIPRKQIAPETLELLQAHPWPGNVRQLENTVERAVTLSGERAILHIGDFSLPVRNTPAAPPAETAHVPDQGLDFTATVQRLERTLIEQAMRRSKGNKKQAADILQLKRTTLNAKLKSLEEVA